MFFTNPFFMSSYGEVSCYHGKKTSDKFHQWSALYNAIYKCSDCTSLIQIMPYSGLTQYLVKRLSKGPHTYICNYGCSLSLAIEEGVGEGFMRRGN